MAAQIGDRLTIQEEEIRWLSDEIGRLLELGMHGTVDVNPSPELEQLRTENEKLKYRIVHLQRCLKEEQERGQAPAETATRPDPGEKQQQQQPPSAANEWEDKGENLVAERQSASQNKKKKEKKPSKEADCQKLEGILTNGEEVELERHHLEGSNRFSKSGHPGFLQLIHKREYCDTMRRPWKAIFPLEDDVNKPVSAIILKRLEEIREPAIPDQFESVKLPRWLEQQEELHFKSSDSTWTVLFQDPSPDKYLLLLKRCRVPQKNNM